LQYDKLVMHVLTFYVPLLLYLLFDFILLFSMFSLYFFDVSCCIFYTVLYCILNTTFIINKIINKITTFVNFGGMYDDSSCSMNLLEKQSIHYWLGIEQRQEWCLTLKIHKKYLWYMLLLPVQYFDTVCWVTGRASGL